ncbi:uncharacterized protein LOC127804830 isoform X2 [Diospyros lotus]|uniref:uncharacterized protein LOC127804830 isoform X2 n=1 Tax=Diospyros lotus TaxID=55363 RepID=UPI0022539021|nr:uncharacterized protein LOC127804830 isoform X2 [Diospyros lotus]
MGRNSRNLARRSKESKPSQTADSANVDAGTSPNVNLTKDRRQEQSKNEEPASSVYPFIRLQYERALEAVGQGNHAEALRLMEDACLRHENFGIAYHAQSIVHSQVASLIDNDNTTKQRHLKRALESARRAATLSPNSIEFASSYVILLYDLSSDAKDYELVVRECERALSIDNPVDPAKDSLQEEEQSNVSTAEVRISIVGQVLQTLIGKSRSALAAQNLGDGEGNLRETIESLKEREREILDELAEARHSEKMLDPTNLEGDEEGVSCVNPLINSAHDARKKRATDALLRKLDITDKKAKQALEYWKPMSIEEKRGLLELRISDLREHFSSIKGSSVAKIFSEALNFALMNKNWKFWLCCLCTDKFINSELLLDHIEEDHEMNIQWEFQLGVVPEEVDAAWACMLVDGTWKPVHPSRAVKMIEEQSKCQSASLLGIKEWPLSDDIEREKLLERIFGLFRVLLTHGCLSMSHLDNVRQYAMNQLRNFVPAQQLCVYGLDQTPFCICFLGLSQLKKIFKFLLLLSNHCRLNMYSNKDTDDKFNDQKVPEILERVVFNSDSSCLLLGENLLLGFPTQKHSCNAAAASDCCSGVCTISDKEANIPPSDEDFIRWLYTCSPIEIQLASWIRQQDSVKTEGINIFIKMEKAYSKIQEMCVTKGELLSHFGALQAIQAICVKELEKRKQGGDCVPQSYASLLRRHQEVLVGSDKDAVTCSSRVELDAISSILAETESQNVNQLKWEEGLICISSWPSEVESSEHLNQEDACIRIAIQRKIEQQFMQLSKCDADMVRIVGDMRGTWNEFDNTFTVDYRAFILPLLKLFVQKQLDALVEKDAKQKSDAAGLSLLAELALDDKDDNRGGSHVNHPSRKLKAKKKNKPKVKGSKVTGSNEVNMLPERSAEVHSPIGFEGDHLDDEISMKDSKQRQEEDLHAIQLEAEERQLEEKLEHLRKIEAQAKQNRLVKQNKKSGESMPLQAENLPLTISQGEESSGDHRVLSADVKLKNISGSEIFGAGLKNDVGEYNCFLNVVIQSLWNLRRFRDKFLSRPTSTHVHVGDPCVVCTLHETFNAVSAACEKVGSESVSPTRLRIALSNLPHYRSFFQEAEMHDASEVLAAILNCLHLAFASGSVISDTELSAGTKCTDTFDCASEACIAHKILGMDVFVKMSCYKCGTHSRQSKYTSFFYYINASTLREVKAAYPEDPFDLHLKLVTMDVLTCEVGDCGEIGYLQYILSTPPRVFVTECQ